MLRITVISLLTNAVVLHAPSLADFKGHVQRIDLRLTYFLSGTGYSQRQNSGVKRINGSKSLISDIVIIFVEIRLDCSWRD